MNKRWANGADCTDCKTWDVPGKARELEKYFGSILHFIFELSQPFPLCPSSTCFLRTRQVPGISEILCLSPCLHGELSKLLMWSCITILPVIEEKLLPERFSLSTFIPPMCGKAPRLGGQSWSNWEGRFEICHLRWQILRSLGRAPNVPPANAMLWLYALDREGNNKQQTQDVVLRNSVARGCQTGLCPSHCCWMETKLSKRIHTPWVETSLQSHFCKMPFLFLLSSPL